MRADSAYYGHDVIAAARRGGARFSITIRMSSTIIIAISDIKESAWVPIHYPNAIWHEDEQRLVSDAEVAEVPFFTAFTSRRKADHISARLIVRRVPRLNPKLVPDGQGELFPNYRHHGVFTDSPLTMLQAEKTQTHRAHAIVEQIIADLKSGALAHLPSGQFASNAAWLVMAAIAFNLTRAAGTIASVFHAKATTATIRRQLIAVPGRLARSARRWSFTCPRTGPGRTAGKGCSTQPADHQPQQRPDHPAQQGPAKDPVETPDRPAATSRPHGEDQIQSRSPNRKYFGGGSRWKGNQLQPMRLSAMSSTATATHSNIELRKEGMQVADEDVNRLSLIGHEQINFLGRYQFSMPELPPNQLRPLRGANSQD